MNASQDGGRKKHPEDTQIVNVPVAVEVFDLPWIHGIFLLFSSCGTDSSGSSRYNELAQVHHCIFEADVIGRKFEDHKRAENGEEQEVGYGVRTEFDYWRTVKVVEMNSWGNLCVDIVDVIVRGEHFRAHHEEWEYRTQDDSPRSNIGRNFSKPLFSQFALSAVVG